MWPCFLPSLLFSLHPWASVCIPSPELPVSSSISFFVVCSLVAMWAQCEMCLSVSFGNMFPRPRKELEMGACKSAWVHTSTNSTKTHMQGHADTCICTDESMLVLKTPTDSEIDMKTSGMEQNRKWVVKEKAAGCLTLNVRTRKWVLWCKQSLQQLSRQHYTSDVCKCETIFMLLPCAQTDTQTLYTSQLTMCHIQYSHCKKKCELVHLVYF